MEWLRHHHHDYNGHKIKETQMHRMHEQKGWIVWCPHLLLEILEIWPPIDTKLKAFVMSN